MSEIAKPTKFRESLLPVGVVFAIIGAIMLFATQSGAGTTAIAKSYFFGWLFWACLTLGMTGLALLHHVVRAKWTSPLYRIWEAGGGWKMLLLVGVAFAPLALMWGPEVWSWMKPEYAAKDPVIAGKSFYLNSGFFTIRWLIYFGTLAVVMYRLATLLRKEEEGGGKKLSDARNWFAPPMLALYVVFFNFAMTDWAMSLDSHWFSTIYGVKMMNAFGLGALAFAMMIFCSQASKEPYKEVAHGSLLRDQGHMMLALTMVWAYFGLSEYLIIWSGNLPEFNVYYIARSINGLNNLGLINILGSFAIPFLLLVGPYSPWMKTKAKAMVPIAALIFFFRFVDFHYVISPSLHEGAGIMPQIGDLGGLLAFGGIWLASFSFFAKQAPLLTESHPYIALETEAAHV